LFALLVCASSAARGSESLVEKTFVFDSTGRHCLDCGEEDDSGALQAIISSRSELAIIRWISEHFEPINPDRRPAFRQDLARGEVFGLRLAMSNEDGITFPVGDLDLSYRLVKCRIWDCYKGYLSLIDRSGNTLWRRRIMPFLVPVYPFVVGDYVLFVGGREDASFLVVIDRRTGATLEEYPLPKVAGGYGLDRPVDCFPFYKDGYVVVQGAQPSTLGPEEVCRMRIHVLKLRL